MIVIAIIIIIAIVISIYKSTQNTLQWGCLSYIVVIFLVLFTIWIELAGRCDKHLIGLLFIVMVLVIFLGLVQLIHSN